VATKHKYTVRCFVSILFACVVSQVWIAKTHASELKFKWPLPSTAEVVSREERGGHTSHWSYKILARAEKNGDVLIEFTDVTLKVIDGKPVSMGDLSPNVRALYRAMPSFRVDGETAQVKNIIGFDAMVQRILELEPEGVLRSKLEAMFKTSRMKVLLHAKMQELWNAAVASWIGLDLGPGEALKTEAIVQAGEISIPMHITYFNDGSVGKPNGEVKFRLISLQEGPEFEKAVALAAQQFMDAVKPGTHPSNGQFDGTRKTVTVIAVLDPNTTRPSSVIISEDYQVMVNGKAAGTKRKKIFLTFSWSEQ
jgi:hypothetical protein